MPENELIHGDALEKTKQLADDAFDMCLTSPAYFLLCDYGVENDFGVINDLDEYIAKLTEVFRQVRRVLKPSGSLWLNMDDSFAGSGGHNRSKGKRDSERLRNNRKSGSIKDFPPQSKLLVPQRLAIALQNDGWIHRMDIAVKKTNNTPEENVLRRNHRGHEYLFHFVKSTDNAYFRPTLSEEGTPLKSIWEVPDEYAELQNIYNDDYRECGTHPCPMNTQLAKQCVLQGCPPDGIVFDPFSGVGTSGHVANEFGCHYVGIEANKVFHADAVRRLIKRKEREAVPPPPKATLDELLNLKPKKGVK